MNNINMTGMNTMGGGPVGGMPMMNNGGPAAGRQPMPVSDNQRSQLNTYIYEYFLTNGMWDCARSLRDSKEPMNVLKDSPGRRRDENGNIISNGAGDEGNDGDLKEDGDLKRPDDLPAPNLPKECPESCFLYEWWCLFWDMFNAQRGKGDKPNILQYHSYTQQQSRFRQESQQNMLRSLAPGSLGMPNQYQQMMMRNPNMNPNDLTRMAMQNNRNATPQQAQRLQQKQQAMQRDPSDGNQQRPTSPGSVENAPSPSKRPRIDGAPFNPQQGGMANGRPQPPGMPAQPFPMSLPAGANPAAQAKSLAAYQAGMQQQQASQMPAKGMTTPNGPQNQGSPMMSQGQNDGALAGYYNAGGEMATNGMRGHPGSQPGGGNHALQDYQMQLMLLEQQNKKRLMMARQEQDSMTVPRPDGPGGPGNGPFPGTQIPGTSPQGPRSGNSPNPTEQMRKATPHMNPAGIPSPLPDGQSRGSPSAMNFNMPGGQMDPNMPPQFYKMNGMDGTMVPGVPNGMRPPPSSHPAGFPAQMTPHQIAIARQQQAAQQQAAANWQSGQNGQMVQQQAAAQGGPQQNMGTPQPRPMAPPSAPAATGTANGRTNPSSPQQTPAPPTPQQGNKANPKKKAEPKDQKAKARKKGSAANLNSGATPSADATQEPATPTPATPITPVHPTKGFPNGQNGVVQTIQNGQPAVAATTAAAPTQQPDPLQSAFPVDSSNVFDMPSFEFANPGTGNLDVLQDFDFDSFLHQDNEGVENFNFDTSGFLDGGEIGAD